MDSGGQKLPAAAAFNHGLIILGRAVGTVNGLLSSCQVKGLFSSTLVSGRDFEPGGGPVGERGPEVQFFIPCWNVHHPSRPLTVRSSIV